MTDFFKSAFGMFGQNAAGGHQQAGVGGGNQQATSSAGSAAFTTTSHAGNDFVGQSIQVGSARLRVTRVLAEGGYAIVYVANDVNTGVDYALKVYSLFYNEVFFLLYLKSLLLVI